MNFSKIKVISASLLLVLTSCTPKTVSAPQKGLNLWLENVNSYYSSLGIENPISVNYAGYAWIQDDGIIAAESLKNTVWYSINYTMTAKTSSGTFNTYVLYDGINATELNKSDGPGSYAYAVSLIKNGSLSGEIGKL